MPTMRRTILTLTTAAPLLLLAACDGYEMQRYTGFPYDNQRTAGSGVQYVLAKMMPTKGPVLEPVAPPAPAPAPEPAIEIPPPPVEPITPADPVFDNKARK
jgi:hypothetical protein